MKIRITFTEEMLGTASANPEIHAEFIASKAPDAETRDEEVAAIGVEEAVEKSTTVFPRDVDGCPMLWDYQVKGFLKDSVNAIREIEGSAVWVDSHGVTPPKPVPGQPPAEPAKAPKRLNKYAYKRTMDNLVFVIPRRVRLVMPAGGEVGHCERPLRAETMRGERIALARSETVPEGTTCEVEVSCLDSRLNRVVTELLDYGKFKGIGQWRNSGKGRFTWKQIGE
jgi:hypothetical protein